MEYVKLNKCSTIIAGQSPESKYYNTNGDGIPFFQGKADFGELYPTIRVYCSNPVKVAEKDDILLSVRAPVGPTNLSPGRVCIGRGLTAIRPNDNLELKYLLYFFKYFEAQLRKKGTGTTFGAITQSTVKNLEVPVLSLPEQERIVSRIEELLSQLDSGVETLNMVKRQLAAYRQIALKEAFQGLKDKAPIKQLSSLVTSGSRGWAKYYSEQGSRFIRITDLTRDGIQLKNDSVQYVSLPDNTEGKRSLLCENDVLISITADLGSVALVPENVSEAYINQHIAMVRFKNPAQGKFMAWYLKSESGQKDLLKNKRGNGKLGLGLDDIRNTPVPVVNDGTANEIVSRIDQRLSTCDNIEASIEDALRQSEAMRQSILKRAFEGEL